MTQLARHFGTIATWLLILCCSWILPVLPATAQSYVIRALGAPPTNPAFVYASIGCALNNKDEVLASGVFGDYNGTPSMYLLSPDYGIPIGLNYLPFSGVTNMSVLAMNDRIEVANETGAPGPMAFNDQGQILGTLMSPVNACVWKNGTVTSLGSLGGGISYPFEINQNGDVIGYSNTFPGDTNMVPFLFLAGTDVMQPITGLNENSVLVGFNSQRQVLYTSRTNFNFGFSLWQNGRVQSLADVIGVPISPPTVISIDSNGVPTYVDGTYHSLSARSLNDNGEIYGHVNTTITDHEHTNGTTIAFGTASFFYSPNGGNGFQEGINYDILQAGNDTTNVMITINNSGQVIYLSDFNTFENPFSYDYYLWDKGQTQKIQDLLPADSGWTDLLPYGLNDRGDIVGSGFANGISQAFLLYVPGLSATVKAAPAAVNVGDQITVTVTAINNNKIAPSTLTQVKFLLPIAIGGNGGVKPQSSVTPPSPVTLAAGQSVSFTENYIATSNGPVTFSANLSGNDPYGNATSAFGTTQITVGTFSETGHIYCVCDSNIIAGAAVEIGTNSATTGPDGAYTVTNLGPQKYTVTVSAPHYQTFITNLTVSMDGTNDYYVTNGTFLIHAILDSSITELDDADTISNVIAQTVQSYSQWLADPICVRILFSATNSGLGASYTLVGFIDYSQYISDLQANTNMSANDIAALATLNPTDSGITNLDTVRLTLANLDAIGEHAEAATVREDNGGLDSQIYLNFGILNVTRPGQDPAKYDLQSTVAHETDEVLGIGGTGSTLFLTSAYTGQSPPARSLGPLDLFRYRSPGVRSYSLAPNVPAYFSIDAGTNNLVDFNQYGRGSDYGDWGNGTNPAVGTGNTPSEVQDAFGTPGGTEDMGPEEFIALDVVGYTLSAMTTVQAPVHDHGTFAFTVATLPGLTYQVQYSTNLASNSWQNFGDPFVSTGLTAQVSDPGPAGVQRYYRIITLPSTGAKPQAAVARSLAAVPGSHLRGTALAEHYLLPASWRNNPPVDQGSQLVPQ